MTDSLRADAIQSLSSFDFPVTESLAQVPYYQFLLACLCCCELFLIMPVPKLLLRAFQQAQEMEANRILFGQVVHGHVLNS